MFRVKRGPVLLWSVATVVQRTNERAAGITGANPVTIKDHYQTATFEIACTALVNLNLTDVRILAAYTATAFNPVGLNASVFCLPVSGSVPLLTTGTGAIAQGTLRLNNLATAGGGGFIVPPILMLEYSTAAPGATPNLTFEVRAFFEGNPFYDVDP